MVVRSLGRAGFDVTLAADRAGSSTALSRFVSDVWVYDNATPQRFWNHLEAFLRHERPDFVFATDEAQLRRLVEAAPRLEPLSTWVNPEFGTLARCFDKRAMCELALALGVPARPCTSANSAEDLPVPGVRHYCHVAAADGRLLAYFQEKLPPAHSRRDAAIGVAGVSVPPSPELRAHCETLTRALSYTGIGCVHFIVDESTGAGAFLQFEARMDGTAALPYRLGLDYPLLAVQLAAYRKARAAGRTDAVRLLPAPPAVDYAPGKRNPLAFDWSDPIPSIHLFWRERLEAPLRRRLAHPRPRLH